MLIFCRRCNTPLYDSPKMSIFNPILTNLPYPKQVYPQGVQNIPFFPWFLLFLTPWASTSHTLLTPKKYPFYLFLFMSTTSTSEYKYPPGMGWKVDYYWQVKKWTHAKLNWKAEIWQKCQVVVLMRASDFKRLVLSFRFLKACVIWYKVVNLVMCHV